MKIRSLNMETYNEINPMFDMYENQGVINGFYNTKD